MHRKITKICILLFAGLLLTVKLAAQTTYFKLIDSAFSLYGQKAYQKAGLVYQEAFVVNGGLALQTDRYNAACAWALADQPDLAFAQLKTILSGKGLIKGWDDPADFYRLLLEDADLKHLYQDKRWAQVTAAALKLKQKFIAGQHIGLVNMLDTIRKDDQTLRLTLDTIRKEKGVNSEAEKALWAKINANDVLNMNKIGALLEKQGWLSPAEVGFQGNQTIFLVIQHAPVEVQRKYLPMMRKAVKQGKALPKDLALLEDRVAMRSGQRQLYGSQVGIDKGTGTYYLYPVVDPEQLDVRRAKVGLTTIASYLKPYGLNWDLAAYQMQLPDLERRLKK